MPMPCSMTVEGEKQGNIEGSCDMKDKEKSILVYAMEHTVRMPRDPQTGLSSGRRLHEPIVITKEIDKSSPKLYQALCTGEHLKKVEIKYYRIDKQGQEEHYYTQTLEDAIVVSMEPYVPVVFVTDNESYRHMEKVGFTYARIKWLWKPDGVESEDSWTGKKA